ncbi:hypothetical protein BU23DRAFT_477739 [Bimuria novae-zelandiae CBS 107.79]|uniref:NACHT domain-containing protein n=1 Tax=Bimuria novae-zelandiae CBS 107.79 TaxID=1447943 RepID=A0A6A5UWX9_9PLEO|nr:hypothetical protein BU23DRAFT_477739 [Bimuria novae-zelandiae CBS 107.79]
MLDALDECVQRADLMDMLETIAGWQFQNLHLLVTSRRERDIENSLEVFVDGQHIICLQSVLVDKDIQRYVRQRLSDDKRLRKWERDAAIMGDIEATLMDGAKGMFRWAVCQLDELGKCVNRKMLQKALATLPPSLDETYDRILSAISEDYSQYAIRILRWLTFSARPLSIDEVAEIAAIDVEREPMFDREEVLEDPLEALNICSSLITVDNEDRMRGSSRQIAALAHYSVKEYLVSTRILRGKAAEYGMQDTVCHGAISTGCLGYLLQFQQPKLAPDKFLEMFKLARYSAEFWISHLQKTGD